MKFWIIFYVLVFIVSFYSSYNDKKKLSKLWQEFLSEEKEIIPSPTTFFGEVKFSGKYKGLQYALESNITKKSDYRAEIAIALPKTINISKIKITHRVVLNIWTTPILGTGGSVPEVKTGEKVFDKTFTIITENSKEDIEKIFSSKIRRGLIEMSGVFKSIEIDKEKVYCRTGQAIQNKLTFSNMNNLLFTIANSISGKKEIDDTSGPPQLTQREDKFCFSCNKTVSSENKFCIHCGQKI